VRWSLALVLLAAVFLFVACGDEAAGPTDASSDPPEPPQILTAIFQQGVLIVAGSSVADGEIPIGQVTSIELTKRGETCAVLEIEPEHAPVDLDQHVEEVEEPGEPSSLALSPARGDGELSSRSRCR
jgi:hypothetical protein